MIVTEATPLSVSVTSYTEVPGGTVYNIVSRRGEQEFKVTRRFSEFKALHTFLKIPSLPKNFPVATVVVMTAAVRASRVQKLNDYLNTVLSACGRTTPPDLMRFLRIGEGEEVDAGSFRIEGEEASFRDLLGAASFRADDTPESEAASASGPSVRELRRSFQTASPLGAASTADAPAPKHVPPASLPDPAEPPSASPAPKQADPPLASTPLQAPQPNSSPNPVPPTEQAPPPLAKKGSEAEPPPAPDAAPEPSPPAAEKDPEFGPPERASALDHQSASSKRLSNLLESPFPDDPQTRRGRLSLVPGQLVSSGASLGVALPDAPPNARSERATSEPVTPKPGIVAAGSIDAAKRTAGSQKQLKPPASKTPIQPSPSVAAGPKVPPLARTGGGKEVSGSSSPRGSNTELVGPSSPRGSSAEWFGSSTPRQGKLPPPPGLEKYDEAVGFFWSVEAEGFTPDLARTFPPDASVWQVADKVLAAPFPKPLLAPTIRGDVVETLLKAKFGDEAPPFLKQRQLSDALKPDKKPLLALVAPGVTRGLGVFELKVSRQAQASRSGLRVGVVLVDPDSGVCSRTIISKAFAVETIEVHSDPPLWGKLPEPWKAGLMEALPDVQRHWPDDNKKERKEAVNTVSLVPKLLSEL